MRMDIVKAAGYSLLAGLIFGLTAPIQKFGIQKGCAPLNAALLTNSGMFLGSMTLWLFFHGDYDLFQDYKISLAFLGSGMIISLMTWLLMLAFQYGKINLVVGIHRTVGLLSAVFLGFLFLEEKLNFWQWLGVFLACIGIIIITMGRRCR